MATGTSRANPSRGFRRGGSGAARGGVFSKPVAESSDWTTQEDPSDTSEEVTQLRNKYGNQLKLLRDVFPEWTAEDLLFTLEEANGDVSVASDRIAGGLNLFTTKFLTFVYRSCSAMGTSQEEIFKGQIKGYRAT
jgi:CUE domain